MSNKKKSVIITGSSGGIGSSLCYHFKKSGWYVIATSRNKSNDSLYFDEFIELDLNELVKSSQVLSDFYDEVQSITKKNPLVSIINNAALQIIGSTDNLSPSDMAISLNVNTIAPFLLAKSFKKELSQNKGTILNIGTVHAQATKAGFVAYTTSKSALHGLTRALAIDLAPDIRVNTLAPGATLTPMLESGFKNKTEERNKLDMLQPLKRISTTSEVAKAALFLCSDDSSFITGSTLYADGGILSKLNDPF